MNCQETRKLLHAYLDGELDLANSLALEEHLHSCPLCTQQWQNQQTLRTKLNDSPLYFKAPPALRQQLAKAMGRTAPAPRTARRSWNWWTVALPLAACLVAAAVVVHNFSSRNSSQAQLVADLTASHIRSLMVDHVTD